MLSIYLILFFGSLCSNVAIALSVPREEEALCLDSHFDASSNNGHQVHKWTPCKWKSQDIVFNKPSYLRFSTDNNLAQETTSAPFDITFHCLHTAKDTCQKAERAFNKAANMISSVVLFRESVRVNATLMSFCQTGAECGQSIMTLGGSSPARAMPLLNNDGMMRLHPQALVKQFGLADHPAFVPYDILSVFNADAPFWFEEDGVPIESNQADFMFVILHEFMHGLGFYSGWNEYIATSALTPDPSPFLANQLLLMVNPTTNALHTHQFLESAMDRLMTVLEYDNNNIPRSSILVSSLTAQLNKIDARTITDLVKSPEFAPALQMDRLATTSGSLGIEISLEKEPIVLETGLNPFQPGSSVSHVAYEKYTQTPDFLMRFMQDRGLTLADAVKRGGGQGPIGPLLLSVLEEIGFATINNPNTVPPLLIFQQQGMTDTIINELDKQSRIDRIQHQHRPNSTDHQPTSSGPSAYSVIPQNILFYSCVLSVFLSVSALN